MYYIFVLRKERCVCSVSVCVCVWGPVTRDEFKAYNISFNPFLLFFK